MFSMGEFRKKVSELRGKEFADDVMELDLKFLGELVSVEINTRVFEKRCGEETIRTTLYIGIFLGGRGFIKDAKIHKRGPRANPSPF